MKTQCIITLKKRYSPQYFFEFHIIKANSLWCQYDFSCIKPPTTSRGEQGQPNKPDHPSSCSYNVSDRDVDYDISAESAFNHPGTKKRIYGETFLAQI